MNAFARKFLWVLDVVDCGGAATVVEWAKRTGYALAVKWNDGDPADDSKWGFQEGFRQVMAVARPLGIPVYAWGYLYGDTYGKKREELSAIITTSMSTVGAAGYIINAEKEWEVPEGKTWAKWLMSELRRIVPDFPIAYCGYWNTRWHGLYPAKEFSEGGCVATLPQLYFMLGEKDTESERLDMLRTMYEDYNAFGIPVYPVGQFCGYREGKWDPQETEGTMDFIRKLGPSVPHSLWLLDGQVPEMEYRGINLTALEAMNNLAVPTMPQVIDPGEDNFYDAVISFIDSLQTALDKLRSVVKSL